MKKTLISLVLLASTALSAKIPEHLLEKKEHFEGRIKIGSVTDTTIKNDADEKVTVLKFYTCQDERDKLNYRMRVTIELTDKRGKGDSYFAQLSCKQRTPPIHYTGESDWEFQLPHGNLEKPKLTAYAVQYGFLEEGVFVPVAEKFDDVDSADEITDRTSSRLNGLKCTKIFHWYRD